MIDTGKVEAGVEFELVVVRLHMFTEFVKGFVVALLFKMRKFMYYNHL